jgi:hypothetical protein
MNKKVCTTRDVVAVSAALRCDAGPARRATMGASIFCSHSERTYVPLKILYTVIS